MSVEREETNELPEIVPEGAATLTERRWFIAMAGMLFLMMGVVVFTGVTQMLHPMSDVETIDATSLHKSGEFTENNLGVTSQAGGAVTVRIIAQQYMFVPHCVTVPVKTPIRFRLTSADVTHGFFVGETNTNAMVVPGFITTVRTSFGKSGDLEMPCDEYCGYGHHGMAARVIVVPKETFDKMSPDERMSCGTQ
jgi:cytochrome c oxidase subunit 2